jgi:hypothetical protein
MNRWILTPWNYSLGFFLVTVGFVQEIISNCFPTTDFETDFATTDVMVTLTRSRCGSFLLLADRKGTLSGNGIKTKWLTIQKFRPVKPSRTRWCGAKIIQNTRLISGKKRKAADRSDDPPVFPMTFHGRPVFPDCLFRSYFLPVTIVGARLKRTSVKKKVVLFSLFVRYGCCTADSNGSDYGDNRDRGPGLQGSRLGDYCRWGCLGDAGGERSRHIGAAPCRHVY